MMERHRDILHTAIMHDTRRAERLPRLVRALGASLEDVRSGKDSSITIGDGTRRGPWTAMRWCLLDFLDSGRPWCLLLEDDAAPTAGAVGSDQPPVTSDQLGTWRIREAAALVARHVERWWGSALEYPSVVHLCAVGGDAARIMDEAEMHGRLTAPLHGHPVGTVAVLLSREAAERIRNYWQPWHRERAFEKKYPHTPHAGDARLWEMEREHPTEIVRLVTSRSLVEHGLPARADSLVCADRALDPVLDLPVAEHRGMHRPVDGCPVEWVRAMSDGGCPMAESEGSVR